jgi:hypothetical protein
MNGGRKKDCDYGFIFGWVPRGKGESESLRKQGVDRKADGLPKERAQCIGESASVRGLTFRALPLRPFQTSTTDIRIYAFAAGRRDLPSTRSAQRKDNRPIEIWSPPTCSKQSALAVEVETNTWRARPALGRVSTKSTPSATPSKAHKIWHHSLSGHEGPTTSMHRAECTTTTCQAPR